MYFDLNYSFFIHNSHNILFCAISSSHQSQARWKNPTPLLPHQIKEALKARGSGAGHYQEFKKSTPTIKRRGKINILCLSMILLVLHLHPRTSLTNIPLLWISSILPSRNMWICYAGLFPARIEGRSVENPKEG